MRSHPRRPLARLPGSPGARPTQGHVCPAGGEQVHPLGASPRAAQALALTAKVRALLDGRYNVSFEDVRRVYLPALRHRIIVNFEAQAEGIQPDQILLELLEQVPEKDEG